MEWTKSRLKAGAAAAEQGGGTEDYDGADAGKGGGLGDAGWDGGEFIIGGAVDDRHATAEGRNAWR